MTGQRGSSLGARIFGPVARLRDATADALHRARVAPDAVSWAGCALSLGAAGCLAFGASDLSPWSPFAAGGTTSLLPFLAFCLLVLSGFLDVVDGALARRHGLATASGALLDSTLDRVSDLAVHAAIVAHFAARGDALLATLAMLAFSHGVLIAYLRARVEALKEHAAVGFWQRSERCFLLGFGCFWGHVPAAMLVLATLPALTAWRRFRQASRLLRGAAPEEADAPAPWMPASLMPWRQPRESRARDVLALLVLAVVLLGPSVIR